MKICIFETEHFEVVFTLLKLFDNGKNKIVVIIDKKIFQRFSEKLGPEIEKFEWRLLDSQKGKMAFFQTLLHWLKKEKPDLLYFNTISNNHLVYYFIIKLLPKTRIIWTIHEINCLFSTTGNAIKKVIVRKGKKLLINVIEEYNVLLPSMVLCLEKKLNKKKRIYNIPGAVHEENTTFPPLFSPVRLVVPGTIEKKRRDYEEVFELAEVARQLEFPLRITLLGGQVDDYGTALIERARHFQNHYVTFNYFVTKEINQDLFDSEMKMSHFVYIPLVIKTYSCENVSEIYGLTKSSGNISDVINHATPFIAPQKLIIPDDLHSSCYKYDKPFEIIDFLKKNLADPNLYAFYRTAARQNALHYTTEKIRQRYPEFFC